MIETIIRFIVYMVLILFLNDKRNVVVSGCTVEFDIIKMLFDMIPTILVICLMIYDGYCCCLNDKKINEDNEEV